VGTKPADREIAFGGAERLIYSSIRKYSFAKRIHSSVRGGEDSRDKSPTVVTRRESVK
jgi:hypothetical protein